MWLVPLEIGVAKNATLVGVKVLAADGRGSFAAIVAGMGWVALLARGTKAVVNMPLGNVCGLFHCALTIYALVHIPASYNVLLQPRICSLVRC